MDDVKNNNEVYREWFTWDWKDDITFCILCFAGIVFKFEL